MKLTKTINQFFFGVFFLSSVITQPARAQVATGNIPELTKGFYLVAGAFQLKKNAVRYSKFINAAGESSKIGLNPEKNLYYVYVFSTQDLELIKSKWTEYRLEKEFEDAWVFKYKMPEQQPQEMLADGTQNQQIFTDPSEQQKIQTQKIDIPEPEVVEESTGFKYVFNVVNSTTLKEVSGFISVVDALRNKVITSVDTNVPVEIPDPGTETKEVIFVCDIFGYVKQQVSLKLHEPLQPGSSNVTVAEDGTTVVDFELARHKAGDILTMYHVYFYNDAAIMKPESKFELNSLLDMLKENENLKIKIHGHTNGSAPGKIIKLQDGDNNYFEVTANNIEGYGSAKELSAERSKIIKMWLMEQGINEKRMELKGWGGKKMVYDKKSELAAKNVRVEIEILKD